MVFFNHATRQMTAKIVYYGPGLCGKTTNLNTIYGKTSQKARGEMVSLNTETDRTLFFDLLPMDVGMVGGFKTKLQLYTVPGQVFYNSTRKLVLKGVDGIVFVVDSQTAMVDAGRESLLNLEENLRELGLNLDDIPMVFQWNKRDLRNVLAVEELEAAFNPKGVPSFQSVASEGAGVFETLRGITKLALFHIKTHVMGETAGAAVPPPAQEPQQEAEPLSLSDLPSVSELLDLDGPPAGSFQGVPPLPDDDDDTGLYIEAPVFLDPPAREESVMAPAAAPDVPIQEPLRQDFDPSAITPRTEAPAPPAVPAAQASLFAALDSMRAEARRPALRARPADHRDAVTTFLGGLTRAGHAPGLCLEVPADPEVGELEVVVQVRQRGQVLVEGQVNRPVPQQGSSGRLSIELKRG